MSIETTCSKGERDIHLTKEGVSRLFETNNHMVFAFLCRLVGAVGDDGYIVGSRFDLEDVLGISASAIARNMRDLRLADVVRAERLHIPGHCNSMRYWFNPDLVQISGTEQVEQEGVPFCPRNICVS